MSVPVRLPGGGLPPPQPLPFPLRLPPAAPNRIIDPVPLPRPGGPADWDWRRGDRARYERTVRRIIRAPLEPLAPPVPPAWFGITQAGTPTTTINSTAGTTCTVSVPASMTTSHYLMLAVCISGNKVSSLNTPSGWTMLGSPLNNSTSCTLVVYGRFWASGMANPSVTWTSSNKNVGCIVPFLGVDPTTQMDVAVPTFGTGSSTTPTSPTATAATHGACRIHIAGRGGTGTSSADFRMVEAVDITTSSTSPASLTFNYECGMAAGALGTRANTQTASAAWVAATLWLRPATPDAGGLLQSAVSQVQLANSVSATFPNALTAGSLVLADVSNDISTGPEVGSVSYNSGANVMTERQHPILSGVEGSSFWDYVNNQVTSAATVTATRSGSGNNNMTLLVREYVFAAGTLAYDTSAVGTGSGTTATASETPASGTVLVITFATRDGPNNPAVTGPANYTQRYVFNDGNSGQPLLSYDRIMTGGSTESPSIGLGISSNWQQVIASYYVPSAAPPALPRPLVVNQAVQRASVM